MASSRPSSTGWSFAPAWPSRHGRSADERPTTAAERRGLAPRARAARHPRRGRSRPALERLGEGAWSAALDYVYEHGHGAGHRRAGATTPELRKVFFGPVGAAGPGTAGAGHLRGAHRGVPDPAGAASGQRLASARLRLLHAHPAVVVDRRRGLQPGRPPGRGCVALQPLGHAGRGGGHQLAVRRWSATTRPASACSPPAA